ncbi:MAG: hypothetical protein J0M24_10630 [Verrucomicrobia bacterium]|nr:hypothetical protein [Verrucomicrobiota bacterium]
MTRVCLTSRNVGILACLTLIGPEVRAVIVYDNLSATTSAEGTVGGSIQQAQRIAPLSVSHTLTSITLLMSGSSTGARLALYSGDESTPSTEIGVLLSPGSITSERGENIFTTPGLTLNAGVNYWVVLSADSGGFSWAYTDSNTGLGEGYASNWANNLGGGWQPFDNEPFQMSVEATAVPEPATLVFHASLALAGLALVKGLRKQRPPVLAHS